MTNPVEEIKYFSGEVKKIHHLQFYNRNNTQPMMIAVDILFSGEEKAQTVTVFCKTTTTGDIFPQIVASMLSDYASGNNKKYNIIMNLFKKKPEHKSYLIDSILLKD